MRLIHRRVSFLTIIGGGSFESCGQRPRTPEVDQAATLIDVSPPPVTTGRASGDGRGLSFITFRVVACWAQPPTLDQRLGRGSQVDLIDPHTPALCVEGVEGSQFANGRARRPQVLVCLVPPLTAVVDANDRVQLHAGFGKCVVGQDSCIGQDVQRVALSQLSDQSTQHPSASLELGLLLISILQGQIGIGLQLLEPLARALLKTLEPCPFSTCFVESLMYTLADPVR